MLLRCDCLLSFYCQMFCHNIVNRAQCDLPLYVVFFPHIFQCQCFVTCNTHMLIFSWGFWQLLFPELRLHHLCLISFYSSLSSCSSSTINLISLFTSMAFSEFSFMLCTQNFHLNILLYYIVCFLNNTIFFVIFYLVFCAAFKTVWLTYFTNVIVYLIFISEHFATRILQELSVIFLGKFLRLIFYCKYYITWCSSTFILSSFFTSVGFSLFTFIVSKIFRLFSCCLLIFHIIFSWSFLSSQHQFILCCLDFSFFLYFCCLINLLRYLEAGARAGTGTGAGAGAEVGAGAGAEVGAGAGAGAAAGAGEGKNKLYEDWLSPPCGVWVETCHQLISIKEENYLNLGPKQYLPSFSDSH